MHVGSHWNPHKIIFNLIYVARKNNLNQDSNMTFKVLRYFLKVNYN